MTTELIFHYADEVVFVRVDGNNLYLGTTRMGRTIAPFNAQSVRLDYEGTIKEFPDLKDKSDWKEIAIERFKAKFAEYKTEDEKINYLIRDLSKHGYIPKFKQVMGHRIRKIGVMTP